MAGIGNLISGDIFYKIRELEHKKVIGQELAVELVNLFFGLTLISEQGYSYYLESLKVKERLEELKKDLAKEIGEGSGFGSSPILMASNSQSHRSLWPKVEVKEWPRGDEPITIEVDFKSSRPLKDEITERAVGAAKNIDGLSYYPLEQITGGHNTVWDFTEIAWPPVKTYFRWHGSKLILKVYTERWRHFLGLKFAPGPIYKVRGEEKKVVSIPLNSARHQETEVCGYFLNLVNEKIYPMHWQEWSLIGRLMDILGYDDGYITKGLQRLSDFILRDTRRWQELVELTKDKGITNYGRVYPALDFVLKRVSSDKGDKGMALAYDLIDFLISQKAR